MISLTREGVLLVTRKIANSKQNNRLTNRGVRTGFDYRDISELERITNNQPRIQIFDVCMLETEEPEQRRYYCANDKSLISYLNGRETRTSVN